MDWKSTVEKLKADKGHWSEIARETGVHVNGVRNIALGLTPSPRMITAQKLMDYYARRDGAPV